MLLAVSVFLSGFQKCSFRNFKLFNLRSLETNTRESKRISKNTDSQISEVNINSERLKRTLVLRKVKKEIKKADLLVNRKSIPMMQAKLIKIQ